MYPTLHHRSLFGLEPMSRDETSALLAHARSLQRAAQRGATLPMLKGKNLGLLCEAADSADAALFRRAAIELGAHVAHIRPSLSELSTPQEVERTARMLGKLYDAVECQGMTPDLVRQMGDGAGVSIYDGIATPDHPTAKLAEHLDGGAEPGENRRFVLQALLLNTIG
jgi:ornithine carbamoyltransferase